MADVDTNFLAFQHGDIRYDVAEQSANIRSDNADRSANIRYEAAQHTADIRTDVAKEADDLSNQVADYGVRNIIATDAVGDRMISQIDKQYHALANSQFEMMRDISANKARIEADHLNIVEAVKNASALSAKDAEIAVLKNSMELGKSLAAITEKVGAEGSETRRLINELKESDHTRMLIERNAELAECRCNSNHWKGNADQTQYAAMMNQLQAFQSQLTETRQGMVNFGTMAGVGQTSTSNNVR